MMPWDEGQRCHVFSLHQASPLLNLEPLNEGQIPFLKSYFLLSSAQLKANAFFRDAPHLAACERNPLPSLAAQRGNRPKCICRIQPNHVEALFFLSLLYGPDLKDR